MRTLNYNNKIKSYLNSNFSLKDKELENLLTIDFIYDENSQDINEFREIYTY